MTGRLELAVEVVGNPNILVTHDAHGRSGGGSINLIIGDEAHHVIVTFTPANFVKLLTQGHAARRRLEAERSALHMDKED